MAEIEINDIKRFIGRYSIGRDRGMDSSNFLRVKVPGGFITSEQFRQVAAMALKYSKGYAEITDRQDIQLHWINAEDTIEIFLKLEELGFTTDMCGQGFKGPRYGDARNILCCPVSGIDKDELIDGHHLMKRLSSFFIGNPDFLDMPRKFKFSISGCGCDCTRAEINDLALVAVEKDGEAGFTLLVGGSVGQSLPGPRLARPTGIFVRLEDAFDMAVATIEIHRDNSSRESKAKARFKWLLESWGIKKFLEVLKEKLGKTFESYNGPVFLRSGDHSGVKPQKQDMYRYVNVPLLGGIMSSEKMVSLANLVDEYGSGELRLTPMQNIILPNVKELDELLKRLGETGFSLKGSKLRWTSMGCASDFCGKTRRPHAKDMFKEIVDYLEIRFDIEMLDEAGFRVNVCGCPNECCASLIAGIGLEGRLVRENGEIKQSYNLLLGGDFGQKPSLCRLVEQQVPAREVKHKVEALLTNYWKRRNPSEKLSEFCNRHSIEELRSFTRLNEG